MLTFSVFFAIVICVAALIYKSYQRKAMAVEHGIQGTPSTHQIKPMVVEFQTRGPPSTNEWKFRTDDADKTFYIVNLETVSCTCEEFKSRRQKYNVKEIQRLCKHLVRAHQKAGIWAEQEEIVMVLLQNGPFSGGTWCHEKIYKEHLRSGAEVYFGVRKDSEWVDVYTRKRKRGEKAGSFTGAYSKFGFDRGASRWSYGDGPPAAKEIRESIDLIP